jgi:hypothetical protein
VKGYFHQDFLNHTILDFHQLAFLMIFKLVQFCEELFQLIGVKICFQKIKRRTDDLYHDHFVYYVVSPMPSLLRYKLRYCQKSEEAGWLFKDKNRSVQIEIVQISFHAINDWSDKCCRPF